MARKKGGLGGARAEIDRIDATLLRLLNRRASIVAAVHVRKTRRGDAVYDRARTDAILDRLLRLNKGPLRDEQVRKLFTFLLHHFALEHRPPARRRPPAPPLLLAEARPGADPDAVRRICDRHGLRLLLRGAAPAGIADARDPSTRKEAVLGALAAGARGALLAISGDEDEEALADLCHRAKLFCLALRPWPGAGGGR